jgi:hypothetical protein
MDKNKVYYVFKHGHCLDKFDDIYLAEAYAKYCGGVAVKFIHHMLIQIAIQIN